MEKAYVRNPKGIARGKYEANDQDHEDFEQERQIKEWLNREGNDRAIDFQYITSKGTARNTILKSSIRLDQKIGEDGSGTFADIIAGCDGRDFIERGDFDGFEIDASEKIRGYLFILGFNQGEIKWLQKTLLLSMEQKRSRLWKSLIDSES